MERIKKTVVKAAMQEKNKYKESFLIKQKWLNLDKWTIVESYMICCKTVLPFNEQINTLCMTATGSRSKKVWEFNQQINTLCMTAIESRSKTVWAFNQQTNTMCMAATGSRSKNSINIQSTDKHNVDDCQRI